MTLNLNHYLESEKKNYLVLTLVRNKGNNDGVLLGKEDDIELGSLLSEEEKTLLGSKLGVVLGKIERELLGSELSLLLGVKDCLALNLACCVVRTKEEY